jgi:hypothetical protein
MKPETIIRCCICDKPIYSHEEAGSDGIDKFYCKQHIGKMHYQTKMRPDFKEWLKGKYGNVRNFAGMGVDSIRDAEQFARDDGIKFFEWCMERSIERKSTSSGVQYWWGAMCRYYTTEQLYELYQIKQQINGSNDNIST